MPPRRFGHPIKPAKGQQVKSPPKLEHKEPCIECRYVQGHHPDCDFAVRTFLSPPYGGHCNGL